MLRPLTAKEKRVLEFIESFLLEQGIAPSFQEIKEHFGFASLNSVQRYLQQLQKKNYIFIPGGNQKRAITVLHSSHRVPNVPTTTYPSPFTQPEKGIPSLTGAESLSLPLMGRVAAGRPIEAVEHNEFVSVPTHMIRYPDQTYALRVEGESMIEDGILDGDIIFVQKQDSARNGETVVAMVESQATVKKFYFIHSYPQSDTHPEPSAKVELRPANSSMQSFWYAPDQVHIQGIVVGLLRKF